MEEIELNFDKLHREGFYYSCNSQTTLLSGDNEAIYLRAKINTVTTENILDGVHWFKGLTSEGCFVFSQALTRKHACTTAKPLYCWEDPNTGKFHFETSFIKIVN